MLSFQATELAELTSKISLLEDAKKKKEDEAVEWQQKVWSKFLFFYINQMSSSSFIAVKLMYKRGALCNTE